MYDKTSADADMEGDENILCVYAYTYKILCVYSYTYTLYSMM
jgi:hypothetical protein